MIEALRALYGAPEPPATTEPLAQILWENVAYLVPDAKRALAFAALRTRVGLNARDILAAPARTLHDVARLGGMRPEDRVERLRAIALLVQEEFEGDLGGVLQLPLTAAKRALRRFPGIGEPGAEKILMIAGAAPLLALESNGLRVLLRIGFGAEKKAYAATYRSVQEALAIQLPRTSGDLVAAHQLLRRHGQTLCRTTEPRCEACPLSRACIHFQTGVQ